MYGTFKKDEKGRQRDHDDFPWFMLCLFMMILALYGMVVCGSWDVAGRLDTFAIRSKNFMDVMGRAASSVGTSVHAAVQQGSMALTQGPVLLQQEMEMAEKEIRKLTEALGQIEESNGADAMAQYGHAQKVILVQAARVKIISSGLSALEYPEPLKVCNHSIGRAHSAARGGIEESSCKHAVHLRHSARNCQVGKCPHMDWKCHGRVGKRLQVLHRERFPLRQRQLGPFLPGAGSGKRWKSHRDEYLCSEQY